MFVLFVDIRIVPGTAEAFRAATADNHRNTRLEPGNLRFDVLADPKDAERFALYEVYLDESDFRAHQQTAHYLRWKDTVAPMMAVPRRAERLVSVFPDPWN